MGLTKQLKRDRFIRSYKIMTEISESCKNAPEEFDRKGLITPEFSSGSDPIRGAFPNKKPFFRTGRTASSFRIRGLSRLGAGSKVRELELTFPLFMDQS